MFRQAGKPWVDNGVTRGPYRQTNQGDSVLAFPGWKVLRREQVYSTGSM
jgi:hypothetical protein